MKRISNLFLVTLTVLFLSACGGGGSTGLSEQQQALSSIASYAQNGGTPPTLEVYEDAELTGVTAENINEINELIHSLGVNSSDIQGTIDARAAAIEKIRAYANGSSNPPNIEDYEALGVTGVTDTNIDAINALLVGKDADEVDSKGEIQTIVDGYVPPNPNKRIFILGSSTVHAGDYISGDFNDPYGSNRKLEGWGEQLKYYMKDPSKVYNRARSGADSVTYRDPDPVHGDEAGYKDRYWGFTETLINTTNDDNGGFLFIQFGANDSHHHIGTDVFQEQLEAYIADARRLGLTPVLLSPPNNRNHYNSRPYAEYVEPVATSKNVLFLDLHQKSMGVWANYEINEDYDGDGVEDNPLFQTLPEADILYGYLEYHRGINNTHFSPVGANIVAGWVKELACQSQRDDAKLLCSQFLENRNTPNEVPPVIAVKGTATIDVNIHMPYVEKGATASDDIDGDISANIVTTGSVNTDTLGRYTITYSVSDSSGNEVNTTRKVNVVDPNTATVYEDAEDGDTAGWATYGSGANPLITNVEDHGGHAIDLHGDDGLDNGFRYPEFTTTTEFVVSWSLKYTEAFRLFVLIHSTNSPDTNIYMEYIPDDANAGLDGAYIRNGLGANANDGTWHTFTRDIEADFHVIYPDENVTSIVGFAIRGSGRVDDLSTSTSVPQ